MATSASGSRIGGSSARSAIGRSPRRPRSAATSPATTSAVRSSGSGRPSSARPPRPQAAASCQPPRIDSPWTRTACNSAFSTALAACSRPAVNSATPAAAFAADRTRTPPPADAAPATIAAAPIASARARRRSRAARTPAPLPAIPRCAPAPPPASSARPAAAARPPRSSARRRGRADRPSSNRSSSDSAPGLRPAAAPDGQVGPLLVALAQQRIRGLADPVMDEAIAGPAPPASSWSSAAVASRPPPPHARAPADPSRSTAHRPRAASPTGNPATSASSHSANLAAHARGHRQQADRSRWAAARGPRPSGRPRCR